MTQNIQRTVDSVNVADLKNYLKRLRKLKGLSQKEVANSLGNHPSFVGKLEIKSDTIRLSDLLSILAVLNVDPAEFLQHYLNESGKQSGKQVLPLEQLNVWTKENQSVTVREFGNISIASQNCKAFSTVLLDKGHVITAAINVASQILHPKLVSTNFMLANSGLNTLLYANWTHLQRIFNISEEEAEEFECIYTVIQKKVRSVTSGIYKNNQQYIIPNWLVFVTINYDHVGQYVLIGQGYDFESACRNVYTQILMRDLGISETLTDLDG